ncbi:DUF7344 domain-containing protein [Halogranum rubrum]|uniref:DUF7344 domain-containing protein n=1 Tax=Halogranum rubrum TaxID=553466 RepID=UPI000677BEA3|nr:hypothetical protein [Halogranum salarium]
MELTSIQGEVGRNSPDEQSGAITLSTDNLFEILKNERRREVLDFLNTNGGSATLSDVAEHIAAIENGIDLHAISSQQRKRVYIGLYQVHLPKMASYGIIDFEKNRGTIELRPAAAPLLPYLYADPVVPESNLITLRLSAVVVYVLLVAAGLLGVPVLSGLPAAGWAIASTVALLAFVVSGALTD